MVMIMVAVAMVRDGWSGTEMEMEGWGTKDRHAVT
jgi:hypothetical protein